MSWGGEPWLETRETELVVDTLETFQSLCRMRFANDWILHSWNTFDEMRGGGRIGHYQQVMVASLWTKLVSVVLLLLLSGCAVGRAPVRAYHALYCDKMNVDGVHCDFWATPCGRLNCGGK